MTPSKKTESGALKRMIPLIVILIIALAGFFLLRDVLSFDTLRDNRTFLIDWRDNNYLLAVLVFMLAYILVVAFSLPGGALMTLTGGFLFGLFPGGFFVVIAATIGACGIFMAAKMGAGDALHKRLNTKGNAGLMTRMEQGLRDNEISYLFLMRLVPAVPFFVANLAPAFLGVGLRNFALTTFFGIMPGSFVYTAVGAGLGGVFARGEDPNLGIIFEPYILGPIIGLCILAVLPIIIKRFRKEETK